MNSEDPRAASMASGWSDLAELSALLRTSVSGPLRMPTVRLS